MSSNAILHFGSCFGSTSSTTTDASSSSGGVQWWIIIIYLFILVILAVGIPMFITGVTKISNAASRAHSNGNESTYATLKGYRTRLIIFFILSVIIPFAGIVFFVLMLITRGLALDYISSISDQLIIKFTDAKNIYVSSASSDVDELKKYKQMLDEGLITQDEYDAKKKQILSL